MKTWNCLWVLPAPLTPQILSTVLVRKYPLVHALCLNGFSNTALPRRGNFTFSLHYPEFQCSEIIWANTQVIWKAGYFPMLFEFCRTYQIFRISSGCFFFFFFLNSIPTHSSLFLIKRERRKTSARSAIWMGQEREGQRGLYEVQLGEGKILAKISGWVKGEKMKEWRKKKTGEKKEEEKKKKKEKRRKNPNKTKQRKKENNLSWCRSRKKKMENY